MLLGWRANELQGPSYSECQGCVSLFTLGAGKPRNPTQGFLPHFLYNQMSHYFVSREYLLFTMLTNVADLHLKKI